jgi:hypothetical protein
LILISLRMPLASRKYYEFEHPRLDNSFLFFGFTCSFSNFGIGVVIRSEFKGVKAGDHVYGVVREFLNYYYFPHQFNILMCAYLYSLELKRSRITSSRITWTALRSWRIRTIYLGRRTSVFSGCRVSPRSTLAINVT